MSQKQEISAIKQISLLIAVLLGGALFNLLVSFLVLLPFDGVDGFSNTINHPAQHIAQLKFLQISQSICLFILPAFYYAKLTQNNQLRSYYNFKFELNARTAIIIILAILAAVPFINLLGDINSKMTLPSSLSGVESWILETEQRAAMLTDLIVSGSHWWQLLINLFMISVLPAIGEELIFRGILQNTLLKATHNKHIAIVIAAFIFSAFHIQFYGFLPRFFLGMILGYLYFTSGKLWLPMLAHFVNNATATISYYLFNNGLISDTMDTIGTGEDWQSGILSAGILLIIYFYLERNKTQLQLDEFK